MYYIYIGYLETVFNTFIISLINVICYKLFIFFHSKYHSCCYLGQSFKVFLKKLDYVIITQNYRCSQGEIDIIATDKNELVFVEVKTRCSKKYGEAREAVNQYKKKHMGGAE